MRHFIAPVIAVLFGIVSHTQANTLVDPCLPLKVTGNPEYPPYLWREAETGKLVGANQIIVKELAARVGLSAELVDTGSWARALESVRSGQVDMIAGAFFTESRAEFMDYIYPAFLQTSSVVWKRQMADIVFESREDLVGHLITTVTNNSFGQSFDEFAATELTIEYVNSIEQALRLVASGRIPFALYEKNPGIAYAQKLDLMDEVEVMDPPISREPLYFTLSKASECYSESLAKRLASANEQLVSEGFMERALVDAQRLWQEGSSDTNRSRD